MKKILLLYLLLTVNSCFAIDWVNTTTPKGESYAIDKDSITEKNNYLFYNIKINSSNSEDVIVTMQCQKSHPFCTRSKYYKSKQYNELNGNYINITTNMTNRLEPIPYTSLAYASYKKAKNIINENNKPQITF